MKLSEADMKLSEAEKRVKRWDVKAIALLWNQSEAFIYDAILCYELLMGSSEEYIEKPKSLESHMKEYIDFYQGL